MPDNSDECHILLSRRRYPDFDGLARKDDCAIGGRLDLDPLLSPGRGLAERLAIRRNYLRPRIVKVAENFLFGGVISYPFRSGGLASREFHSSIRAAGCKTLALFRFVGSFCVNGAG